MEQKPRKIIEYRNGIDVQFERFLYVTYIQIKLSRSTIYCCMNTLKSTMLFHLVELWHMQRHQYSILWCCRVPEINQAMACKIGEDSLFWCKQWGSMKGNRCSRTYLWVFVIANHHRFQASRCVNAERITQFHTRQIAGTSINMNGLILIVRIGNRRASYCNLSHYQCLCSLVLKT